MVKIYDDYGDEPDDKFIPIPDHLACTYYDLEMDGYTDDIAFFDEQLPRKANILELGCGSGRVARKLINGQRQLTGIDISLPMLQNAYKKSSASTQFVAMDMTNLAFTCSFDAMIIPYNSLNLLVTKDRILSCLRGCRKHLHHGGRFIAQIFIPSTKFLAEKKKTFQFQLFDMEPTGRLIKEILKEYQPATETIRVEERFRVRPGGLNAVTADYNSNYTVAAYSPDTWLTLFKQCGFIVKNAYADLEKTPPDSTDASSLILVCE